MIIKHEKSFIYDLLEPVEISKGGNFIEAVSIEVFAPRNNVYNFFSFIDTEYNKAKKFAETHSSEMLSNLNENMIKTIEKLGRPDEKETKVDPMDLVDMMQKNNANMEKCYEMLGKILTCNKNPKRISCLIDTEDMQSTHYQDLTMADIKNILGLYIKHFLECNRSM